MAGGGEFHKQINALNVRKESSHVTEIDICKHIKTLPSQSIINQHLPILSIKDILGKIECFTRLYSRYEKCNRQILCFEIPLF